MRHSEKRSGGFVHPVIDEKDLSANVNGPVDEESSDYKDRED